MVFSVERRRIICAALAGPLLGVGTPVLAQDHVDYGAEAVVEAPVATTNREDATASGTHLTVEQDARALQTVADVLVQSPGTRVRQLGGFGSFSGLSLRGAEVAQTSVLLGNLPIDAVDEGAFDFSLVPLSALSDVVIYRGGAPAWLGEGSAGGVVQLVPRRAAATEASARLGVGSFGRYHLAAHGAVAGKTPDSVSFLSQVALDGAQNDFPYRNTGGELIASDDRQARVQNAQISQGTGLAHLTAPLGHGQVEALVLGVGRSAGIPGPQKRPSPDAHRQLARLQTMLGYTEERVVDGARKHRVQLLVGGGHQANRVSDPYGQIGVTYPAETDDRWTQWSGRAAGTLALLPWLEGTAVVSARLDDYQPDNPLAFSAPPRPSQRRSEVITGEVRVHGELVDMPSELRLSARGQWSQSRTHSIRETDEGVRRDLLAPTFRVAAAISPTRFLTASTSISSGVRLPSIGELFGDRAFLLENPDLVPERGLGVDAGLVAMGQAGQLCFRGELRAFHLEIADLIRYVRTSQYAARPENLSFGQIDGVELGVDVGFDRHLSFNTALTAMRSRSPSGHALPYRPPLVLHSQLAGHVYPGAGPTRVTLFSDVDVVSYNYTDDKGIGVIPGRQWLGFGAALSLLPELDLQIRAANVLDQESKDLNGFWLPRRTLFASLTLKESL